LESIHVLSANCIGEIGSEIEPRICTRSLTKVLDGYRMDRWVTRKVPFLTKDQKKARLE
jgi:hypothetical protein